MTLKTRIIPCLLFNDRTIIKSVKFGSYRMIGDPTTVARVFNSRNSDEIIFLDINATKLNLPPNYRVIEDIAKECFMPIAIGGGVSCMEHVDKLFSIGADKIILNTSLVEHPALVAAIAEKYGTQAVVASIDVKRINNEFRVHIRGGSIETPLHPVELAIRAEMLGVGEIFLTSIDNDGTLQGYDLELISVVSRATKLPVIASGGCGKLQDFVDAVTIAGADAVSAGSIFYFVGESMITAKRFMSANGISVRSA